MSNSGDAQAIRPSVTQQEAATIDRYMSSSLAELLISMNSPEPREAMEGFLRGIISKLSEPYVLPRKDPPGVHWLRVHALNGSPIGCIDNHAVNIGKIGDDINNRRIVVVFDPDINMDLTPE